MRGDIVSAMPAMQEGLMNEDDDVAFAWGMIAHHHGAGSKLSALPSPGAAQPSAYALGWPGPLGRGRGASAAYAASGSS